jgi:hypothetical protein
VTGDRLTIEGKSMETDISSHNSTKIFLPLKNIYKGFVLGNPPMFFLAMSWRSPLQSAHI